MFQSRLAMAANKLLLNPFVLLALVAAGPLIGSVIAGWSLLVWVQVLVVALTVFAVWVGLASSGE
jgi:hypothetical protein